MSRFLPSALKAAAKNRLLHALHARPEIGERIASRVVRDGVPAYLEWSFEREKSRTLGYLDSLRVGDYEYRFAASTPRPTLYGSVYACMLMGMYGELEESGDLFRQGWLNYLDRFQDPADGLFRDAALAGPGYDGSADWGDGWGARHVTAHAVIAYCRLGRVPRHAFRFLEPYYERGYLSSWLERFDFRANVWSQSNYIMNVFSVMQYARDYMHDTAAASALEFLSGWFRSRQRADTGMWHTYEAATYPELGDALRGAYHFYPLYSYDALPIPHAKAVVDTILRSQNCWGGFNPEGLPSGACEDIDAIDPLIRAALQTGHRQEDVRLALGRAMVWLLACQHPRGGYESVPEHGFAYGGHPLTSSQPGEANLFATWFRSLCLAYMVEYLALPNQFSLGRYPGYEIALTSRGPE